MNTAQISLLVLLFVLLIGARFFPKVIASWWNKRKKSGKQEDNK